MVGARPIDWGPVVPGGSPRGTHGRGGNEAGGPWTHFRSLHGLGLGDSKPGISSLKQYLAHFGYFPGYFPPGTATQLPPPPLPSQHQQLMSDDFDSDTLAALQLYQKSFGLRVSGTLDTPTLLNLMTPRCGRHDVVNGTSLMLMHHRHVRPWPYRRPTFSPLGHFTLSTSAVGTWPPSHRNAITYAFHPVNETSQVSAHERRKVFANAFEEWAAVVPLSFTEIEDYSKADIKIAFYQNAHGDGSPFDGRFGELAHALVWPPDPDNNQNPASELHFDDAESWSVMDSPLRESRSGSTDQIDLQSVALHEIGHVIGLEHSAVVKAVMYPSLNTWEVKAELTPDDIEGAQAIYGVNPSYDPSKPLPGVPLGFINNGANAQPSCLILTLLVLLSSILLPLMFSLYSYIVSPTRRVGMH